MSEVRQQPIILSAENLRVSERSTPISFAVREGEIVGLAGLDGQGQETFLEMLCGLRKPISGAVTVHPVKGETVTLRDFHHAVRCGLAYLPRNRKTQGILPALSVLDNFSIATLPSKSRFGFINRKAYLKRLEQFQQRLSMVYASPAAPITSLSGGNQQKVLLARWMAAEPRVLLLNDPTRGVDLPTRLKLYEVFRETVVREKTALVLLSTEVEEILQLCDRVLVIREDSIFTELSGEDMTLSKVMAGMFGKLHD